MNTDLELSAATHEAIKAYCAEGDCLAAIREFEAAIATYNKAWELIPTPQNDWEAATWVLAAVADAAFLAGYLTTAMEAIEYGMTCPGAIGNPFMHMRCGQIFYDLKHEERAADELMRAYMGAGESIFATEDPKYLKFLETRAIL